MKEDGVDAVVVVEVVVGDGGVDGDVPNDGMTCYHHLDSENETLVTMLTSKGLNNLQNKYV